MSRDCTLHLKSLESAQGGDLPLPAVRRALAPLLAAGDLPFGASDTTAGSETELQVAVAGSRQQVDLPLTIEQSRYFANLVKRAASGDAPERQIERLRAFLDEGQTQVWENSWVRFGRQRLSAAARQVLQQDLLADKRRPDSPLRCDHQRFSYTTASGEAGVRLPVSYLVKLALADVAGVQPQLPATLRQTVAQLQQYFLNDNTSPETLSFYVVPLTVAAGQGQALARETARRFVLTQLLVLYANDRFGLTEQGQQALIYNAPHPPQRQKQLNELIPDSFYRELFMSPCLSGWDCGEDKHAYMHLCHQVLSRSQLNGVAKLREAGIITRNLVVLPNLSNTSLANNGVHVSLGSRRLTAERALGGGGSYPAALEKLCGDLAIKIQEHFLPLFVGTYSAAPYRLGFEDFHPERALGFLAHELDFTHLRMLWRRWRKKAQLKLLGQRLTPFGPDWLDGALSRLPGLQGDFVPDFRLIDYPVSFLSSAESPALDGHLGNQQRLLADLDAMGVFDARMSLYQLMKLRSYQQQGFCGFEGRYYSLFPSFGADMAAAVSLQQLISALAFQYMASGLGQHRTIPDTPQCESERRQIFFGRALGLPTFYVRRDSRNRFLLRILRRTAGVRVSRRYPGYWRVPQQQYALAALEVLEQDGAALIEQLGCGQLLTDLRQRLLRPAEASAVGRLSRAILADAGVRQPLQLPAAEFNRLAERYYRDQLRLEQLWEGLADLRPAVASLATEGSAAERVWLRQQFGGRENLTTAFDDLVQRLRQQRLRGADLLALINLVLLCLQQDRRRAGLTGEGEGNHDATTPVYRAL